MSVPMRGSASGRYPTATTKGSPSKGQNCASPEKCWLHVGQRWTAAWMVGRSDSAAAFSELARSCGDDTMDHRNVDQGLVTAGLRFVENLSGPSPAPPPLANTRVGWNARRKPHISPNNSGGTHGRRSLISIIRTR